MVSGSLGMSRPGQSREFASGSASSGPTSWLDYDPAIMLAEFDRRPFIIRHRLTDHPLLQLPRIVALARSLPETMIEYNSGDLAVDQEYLKTPKTGLSAEATLVQIERCRSWMALKNVERDPEYAKLLEECLAQVAPQTEQITPGMGLAEAFIFVSSPGSITPYHMDPEHNFLLQARGNKRVTVFDGRDRSIVSDLSLEQLYSGAHRNMRYPEELAGRGNAFEVRAGEGLHIPATAPHWVRNGNAVSISFSITFRSKSRRYRQSIYKANSFLRQRGVTPLPPGESAFRDAVKATAVRVIEKWQSLTARRNFRPPDVG
jgi:hypothetical protein